MPDSIAYQLPDTSRLQIVQAGTPLQNTEDGGIYIPRGFLFGDSVCAIPYQEALLLNETQLAETGGPAIRVTDNPADVYGYQSVLKARYTGTVQQVGEGISAFTSLKSIWFDAIAVGLLIYMLLVVTFTKSFLNSLIDNIISYQKTHKIFQVNSQSSSYSRRLYFIPLTLIFGLFTLYLVDFLDLIPNAKPLQNYAIIIALLAIIMLVKYVSLITIGFITRSKNFIDELFYNRQIIMIVAGLLIFPWVLLLSIHHEPAVQTTFMYFCFSILILYVLFMVVRSYFVFKQARVSHFLWILYLCILEIAPYLTLSIVFQ